MSNSAPDVVAPVLAAERIGQIAVIVRDVDRAVAFYRDVLGLQLLFRAPPGLAFFDCGGVRLMLGAAEGSAGDAGTSVLYYLVTDLHAAHEALIARGVAVVDAPHRIARLADHELWMMFLRDSEGNLLGLMSEVPLPV